MLEVKGISFSYGNNYAVKNLSFNLLPGRILGLLGPNGCGKTTTFRMLTNLYQPKSGTIRLNGEKISYNNVNLISYMTEERSLIQKYKVGEMLIFLGKLKGLNGTYLASKIDELLTLFKMKHTINLKIQELSKGNQQKIQFISCLLNNPKLLILDEPFTGLDLLSVNDLICMLEMLRDEGTMIIFSSHRIGDVENFCDDVCLLNHGEAVLQGDLKTIKSNYEQKVIKFKADNFDYDKIKNIADSIKISSRDSYYIVQVSNPKNQKTIIEYLKSLPNLSFLSVEDSSLEQIYINEVTKKM